MSFNVAMLAPELSLLVTALVVILLDLILKNKKVLAAVSIAGILVSGGFALTLVLRGTTGPTFGGFLVVDPFALFFKFLFLASAGLVILASLDYVTNRMSGSHGEFYALILLATLAFMLLSATRELVSIFIALELSSICLYILASMLRDAKSSESGIKYLLLGAIASAVLLYGMALIFGVTGSTSLAEIANSVRGLSVAALAGKPALMLGIIFLIAGFGFKIAAVPFHMWVPDVYEGAPTPVTAFLSVSSKAAGFAVLARVLLTSFASPSWLSLDWGTMLAVLSAVTMTVGNVIALSQGNIKRLMGYSSIAQAGYLIVALAALGTSSQGNIMGLGSIFFFLTSYLFTNLGAFIAIIAISNRINSDKIDDYSGMMKRSSWLAIGLTLCLVSLTGLPPTAGLIAKIYVFGAGVSAGLLWLVVIAVLNSAVSAFYYLKVVKTMWVGTPSSEDRVRSSTAIDVALGISCAGVVLLGIVPAIFTRLAQAAIGLFVS
jgi:NADH-quinone oxidoreductase subunit N